MMRLMLELRAPIYKELVEAAALVKPDCSLERFAELVIESDMAGRRLEKLTRRTGPRTAARLDRDGLQLGAPE
jgi:hypothetical protein